MMSVEEARAYLKAVETLPERWLGPLRLFQRVEDGAPLNAPSRALVASVTQSAPNRFEAPSAWHAAAWLLDLATLTAQVANVDGGSGLRSPLDPKLGAPIFRGQRDASWRLCSTAMRAAPSDVDATGLLTFALHKLMSYGEGFEYNTLAAHMAALQHQGMPTPLMDFSLDPRVATVFACNGASRGARARICFAQVGSAGSIILPPPWVQRLYDQRGLFTMCASGEQASDLERLCCVIEFPADPAFVADYPHVFQTAEEPWYGQAFVWARREVASGISNDAIVDPDVARLVAACGDPPFKWAPLQTSQMARAPQNFVGMLQWLALKAVNGQLVTDTGALDILVRENEGLLRSYRVIFRMLRNDVFADTPIEKLLNDPLLGALYVVSAYLDEREAGRA